MARIDHRGCTRHSEIAEACKGTRMAAPCALSISKLRCRPSMTGYPEASTGTQAPKNVTF